MGLSGFVLSMLVFVTVVYSAAIKGQNEDFLNFLNEAFNKNSPELVVTVSGPSNPVGVSDPRTVCSTSTPMENLTELLGVFTETDSVEYSDTADEKSQENSKSADQTGDYDHRRLKKINKLPETLELGNDSAESKSAERTFMDKYIKTETEKQPSIAQEDRSQQSQEMHGPVDSVTDQKKKRRKNTERGSEEQRVTQITKNKATKINSYTPDQLQAKESNRKSKAMMTRKNSDSAPLNGGQNAGDQSQECVEVSSWMIGYADGENMSVVGTGVNPLSEEIVTKYERQPSKLRTPTLQREQLDTDSAEKVNSELQDRVNSSESISVRKL